MLPLFILVPLALVVLLNLLPGRALARTCATGAAVTMPSGLGGRSVAMLQQFCITPQGVTLQNPAGASIARARPLAMNGNEPTL